MSLPSLSPAALAELRRRATTAPPLNAHRAALLRAEEVRRTGKKRCPVCERTLPVDAFSVRARALDGRHELCRECRAAARRRRDYGALTCSVCGQTFAAKVTRGRPPATCSEDCRLVAAVLRHRTAR